MYDEERTKKKKKHKKHKDKDRDKASGANESAAKQHRHKHKHRHRSVSVETATADDQHEANNVGGVCSAGAARPTGQETDIGTNIGGGGGETHAQVTPEKKTLRLVFKMSNPSGQIETVRTAATVIEASPPAPPPPAPTIAEPLENEPMEQFEPEIISTPLVLQTEPSPPPPPLPPPAQSSLPLEPESKTKKPKKSKHKKHHKHRRNSSASSSSPHKKHRHHHHHHHRRKKTTPSLRIKCGKVKISKTYQPSNQIENEVVGQHSNTTPTNSAANHELPVEPLMIDTNSSEFSKSLERPSPLAQPLYVGNFGVNYAVMNLPFSPPNDGLGSFDNKNLFAHNFATASFREQLSPNQPAPTRPQTQAPPPHFPTPEHLSLDSTGSEVTRTSQLISPTFRPPKSELADQFHGVSPLFSPNRMTPLRSPSLVSPRELEMASPLFSTSSPSLSIGSSSGGNTHSPHKSQQIAMSTHVDEYHSHKVSTPSSSASKSGSKKSKKHCHKSKHSRARVLDDNDDDDADFAPKPKHKIKISLNLFGGGHTSEATTTSSSNSSSSSSESCLIFPTPSPTTEEHPLGDETTAGVFEFKRPFDPTTTTTTTTTNRVPSPTTAKVTTASLKIEKTITSSEAGVHTPSPSVIVHQPTTTTKRSMDKKSKAKPRNLTQLLNYLLKLVQKKDSQHFFAKPVSDVIAPGYSTIIQHPMDLSTIKKRIGEGAYKTLGDFQADIKLMCDNALKYNRPETVYHKAANKLWHYTKTKLFKRDALLSYAKNYLKVTQDELSLLTSAPTGTNSKGYVNGFTTGIIMSPDMQASILMPPPQTPSLGIHKKFKNKTKSSTHGLVLKGSSSTKVASDEDNKKKEIEDNNRIYYDGMTANEIVAQNKLAALEARKRLLRSRPGGVHYSVLRESPARLAAAAAAVETTLHIKSENIVEAHILPLSYSDKVSPRPLDLSQLYEPTENGRINCEVLPPLLMPKIRPPTVIAPGGSGTTAAAAAAAATAASSHSRSKAAKAQESSKPTPPKPMLFIPQPPSPPTIPTKPIFDLSLSQASVTCSNNPQAKKAELVQLIQTLLRTYGNSEFGLEYAHSIGRFAQHTEYTSNLVTQLLNILTMGRHRGVATQHLQLIKDLLI